MKCDHNFPGNFHLNGFYGRKMYRESFWPQTEQTLSSERAAELVKVTSGIHFGDS